MEQQTGRGGRLVVNTVEGDFLTALKGVTPGQRVSVLYKCGAPECGEIHEACGTVHQTIPGGVEIRDITLYELENDNPVERPGVEMLVTWGGKVASRLIPGQSGNPFENMLKALGLLPPGGVGVMVVDLSSGPDEDSPPGRGMQA